MKLIVTILMLLSFAGCDRLLPGMNNSAVPEDFAAVYRLENSYMDYKYFEVDINAAGDCRIKYLLAGDTSQKPVEKEIVTRVPQAALSAMTQLYSKLDFFNFQPQDLNKTEITVKEVGKSTMFYACGGKKRRLVYGYIKDKTLAKLTGMFWNIAQNSIKRSQALP